MRRRLPTPVGSTWPWPRPSSPADGSLTALPGERGAQIGSEAPVPGLVSSGSGKFTPGLGSCGLPGSAPKLGCVGGPCRRYLTSRCELGRCFRAVLTDKIDLFDPFRRALLSLVQAGIPLGRVGGLANGLRAAMFKHYLIKGSASAPGLSPDPFRLFRERGGPDPDLRRNGASGPSHLGTSSPRVLRRGPGHSLRASPPQRLWARGSGRASRRQQCNSSCAGPPGLGEARPPGPRWRRSSATRSSCTSLTPS
jgi:hypothetical protein